MRCHGELTQAGIELHHFLSEAVSAPYVKCDIGMGAGNSGAPRVFQGAPSLYGNSQTNYTTYNDNFSGLVAGVGVGYEFFRNAGVQIDVNLGASAVFSGKVMSIIGLRLGASFGSN